MYVSDDILIIINVHIIEYSREPIIVNVKIIFNKNFIIIIGFVRLH